MEIEKTIDESILKMFELIECDPNEILEEADKMYSRQIKKRDYKRFAKSNETKKILFDNCVVDIIASLFLKKYGEEIEKRIEEEINGRF